MLHHLLVSGSSSVSKRAGRSRRENGDSILLTAQSSALTWVGNHSGALAQLEERDYGIVEVVGSKPACSTICGFPAYPAFAKEPVVEDLGSLSGMDNGALWRLCPRAPCKAGRSLSIIHRR